MSRLVFFGDGCLGMGRDEPVIFFPKSRVVCDYSECGLYIASKHLNREKPARVKLGAVVEQVNANTKVTAWNNGIAIFFAENNIKTVSDLAKALGF